MIACRLHKLMPHVLIPFSDVKEAVEEILDQTDEQIARLGTRIFIKLLRHATIFAEQQFGKRIAGTSSYDRDDRDNSDSMCTWIVEIGILDRIYGALGYHDLSSDDGWQYIITKKIL
jgi:hypothetical protein